MYVAAFPVRAKSANRAKEKYKQEINIGFAREIPDAEPLDGALYAVVYFFHHGISLYEMPDADNLSKPVLDALKGVAYADDRQVLVRTSGLFDLRNGIGVLDPGRIPHPAFARFLSLCGDRRPSVMYVEIGRLHYESHFRFGLEVPS